MLEGLNLSNGILEQPVMRKRRIECPIGDHMFHQPEIYIVQARLGHEIVIAIETLKVDFGIESTGSELVCIIV